MKHVDYQKYSDNDWQYLANLARQQTALSGFYNENYRLVNDGEAFLFRFHRHGEEQFDPRPFQEHNVYQLLEGSQLPIPELLYVSPDHSFQVQRFVEGNLFDEIYPPGQHITSNHIARISDFYRQIALLDINVANYIASDWPQNSSMQVFFEKLLETATLTHRNHQETHQHIYKFLKIPDDPFEHFLNESVDLSERPWRLVHSDIHRANMIEKENGELVIIDWELALYGDLLYCLASHMHRSRFFSDEKEEIAKNVYRKLPADFQTNFMKDLSFYLDYEALKSVIVDSIRFPDLLSRGKASNTTMHEFCVYYADNLNRISGLLSTLQTNPEQTFKWFKEWAGQE